MMLRAFMGRASMRCPSKLLPRVASAVCRGSCPLATVTLCVTSPTSSFRGTSVVILTVDVTFSISSFLKPAASASSRYVAGGKLTKENSPDPPVTWVRASLLL
jgi:hypothetical protein